MAALRHPCCTHCTAIADALRAEIAPHAVEHSLFHQLQSATAPDPSRGLLRVNPSLRCVGFGPWLLKDINNSEAGFEFESHLVFDTNELIQEALYFWRVADPAVDSSCFVPLDSLYSSDEYGRKVHYFLFARSEEQRWVLYLLHERVARRVLPLVPAGHLSPADGSFVHHFHQYLDILAFKEDEEEYDSDDYDDVSHSSWFDASGNSFFVIPFGSLTADGIDFFSAPPPRPHYDAGFDDAIDAFEDADR